jgi:small nuclear ribonucleoprotein (snRNP)-like protein
MSSFQPLSSAAPILDDHPALIRLKETLNKVYRFKITDGRIFTGVLVCIDRDKNIILSEVVEMGASQCEDASEGEGSGDGLTVEDKGGRAEEDQEGHEGGAGEQRFEREVGMVSLPSSSHPDSIRVSEWRSSQTQPNARANSLTCSSPLLRS